MPEPVNAAEHPAPFLRIPEDVVKLDRMLHDRLRGTSMENVTPAARARLAFEVLQLISGLNFEIRGQR
ncbi:MULTISPECIES: hypothetical protein [unclassified Rhizobium]|uniref:hypothetical protein n=1 Tax=unclassified Rhizobium TaxID=2613769 RepID=UPI001C83E974|nr:MULTISPECIES: hypothetical protein [unclassified Rhizobium]MBX5167024.1 hypothetical protein [Rhizobium sp. NZLR4b]MBX5211171.1 hypothetical protein [Rhizobium sp. NZLR11]